MSILVSDWLVFHADRTPEKIALIDQHSGKQLTYAEFNERATRLATYLRDEWSITQGDRVAILAKNSVHYFEFEFACFKLGAIMLPLNWRLAEPELVYIVSDAEAKGIVYDAEFADRIPTLRQQAGIQYQLRLDIEGTADDGAPKLRGSHQVIPPHLSQCPKQLTMILSVQLCIPAGTTGRPKGALITQGMTFWNAANISIPTGLNKDSVFYCVLPTFHTAGLNLYVNPIIHHGGTSIIARNFDAGTALETLSSSELGVTHFFGVPAIYLFMSQHENFADTDLSNIQSWGCGGAPMPVALLETYRKRGIIVQTGFGMTETSPTVFLADKRRAIEKPASVGKPLLHTRVKIVDENFQEVPPNTVGEVVIAGPNITPGYWKRPDANESSFTIDENGIRWLHSGDAGMTDEEGCIYIVDRYKDMYISGGENVYPAEVEQVIFHVEGVADVAVIGVPDERWGESGLAVVVKAKNSQVTEETIIESCRKNLAKYKVPKRVVFVDELPRNAAGKVLKRVLREQFVQQH
ncbi:MAG: acid--CoA ligase [Patescibacteria group bacterium]|nr:MAG: acid--CoA ligase [Patescibacteria group bacterium]